MYVIRNQGFYYTDEYYAPGETFKRVSKKTYETKAEAERACAKVIRTWIRGEPLGYYVFDDGVVIDNILKYLRDQFPDEDFEWDDDLTIPEGATDKQVDEIVKRLEVTFAKVFEVDDDEDEERDEDEDDDDYEPEDDGFIYGPIS